MNRTTRNFIKNYGKTALTKLRDKLQNGADIASVAKKYGMTEKEIMQLL